MVSGIITVALVALFLGGWAWAWHPARRSEFDAAARQPLDEVSSNEASRETTP